MKPWHTRRALWAALLAVASVTGAQAADLSISQFRVRGPAGGNDEFIELFNGGRQALDLSGYKLNASNASGTTGTRLTLASGTSVPSGCYLLLTNGASSGYSGSVAGDAKYSTGITDDGGLAILDGAGQVVDQVGLSAGSAYKAGTPLASLGSTNADKGYRRKTDAAGLPQNSGDNQADFDVASPTTPHDSASTCVVMGQALSIADASVTVHGNVGVGVAENMMSGSVRVKGSASQAAGATAHGGLLVIEGDAGARCGISMKGVDIVVGGSIGHMSCFMGQAGRLVVCGDAGDALGDSLYEVRIYVKGEVKSLGSDCIEKEMRAEHLVELKELLNRAGFDEDPAAFKRYGSARQLYNFKVDNASAY